MLKKLKRWINRALYVVAFCVLAGMAIGIWLWRDRVGLDAVDWPAYPEAAQSQDAVIATWFGVTTVLFDDGETQILIDSYFSRPTIIDIMLRRQVGSEVATINLALNQYQIRRLAAIVPVNSHFDHAMDIGAVANRSSASVLGSLSTSQIARGAGVPEDQIVEVQAGANYSFGNFTVTLVDSRHAPIGWRGNTPIAGTIDEPLAMPAPITAWREGKSYSIVVAHPQGTTIVQGSAGFVEGALQDVDADVVLLGVGGLASLGRDYAEKYWQELVTATGARRVLPIHFDDFTRPFGEIALPPRVLSDFEQVARWLEEFRSGWDSDTTLHLPVFGQPILLYPPDPPGV
jgi:L-ascorbate metabolism protein UlaG (beta-lactamase superfamily)